MRAGTRMPGFASGGISQMQSPAGRGDATGHGDDARPAIHGKLPASRQAGSTISKRSHGMAVHVSV
jgi:hypothetical protein